MNPHVQALLTAGQSIWLDDFSRRMLTSGALDKLIDVGVRGMTSNPTIFEKSIGAGTDYDEQMTSLIGSLHDPNAIFEALAVQDMQTALNAFRPLYDETAGGDGFVSLEVSPLLAHDTDSTARAAIDLWNKVQRPNLMVKIPATPQGLAAITKATDAGVNINVTLIFSVETYEKVANAYLAGLEQRLDRGERIAHIRSIASVFISRIDTVIDALLEAALQRGEHVEELLGKAGIANAKLAYQRYKTIFEAPRFESLKRHGAAVQRPLWGSTGTKNPAYDDLVYVENLVGKNTVNTVPPSTLSAVLDHVRIQPDTIEEGIEGAKGAFERLGDVHISLSAVTHQLQDDGIAHFIESYAAMLKVIEQKQQSLILGVPR